jgi:hypothetical protein
MNNQEADSAWSGGTIGDLSARIGYDVRELILDGYSWRQIREVTEGRITLAELFKCMPENEPIDTKKILSRIDDQRRARHAPPPKET